MPKLTHAGEARRPATPLPADQALETSWLALPLATPRVPGAPPIAEPSGDDLAHETLRMQEALRALTDDSRPATAAAEATKTPKGRKRDRVPNRPEGRKACTSPGKDLVADYLGQLNHLPLLSAVEEVQYATELFQHEVETWRLLLACPRVVQHTLCLLEGQLIACSDATLSEVRALDAAYRRASARSRKKSLADTPGKQEVIRTLSLGLRRADADKILLEKLMAVVRPEVWSRRVLTDQLAYRLTHADLTAIERARGAGLRVRNQFARANLRLVISVARAFYPYRVPFIDLIQEGNLGLLKAVHRFDHTRGFRFSTYAHWWIRQSMERAVANKASHVRLPQHIVQRQRLLRRTEATLQQTLGRPPTAQELAQAAGLSEQKILEATAHKGQVPISLSASVAPGSARSLVDVMQDEAQAPLDEAFIRENTHAKVRELLHLLTPIEKDIIRRRFGLGTDVDQTLDDIGAIYNVSRERVRQIQAQSLLKMRRMCARRQIE